MTVEGLFTTVSDNRCSVNKGEKEESIIIIIVVVVAVSVVIQCKIHSPPFTEQIQQYI